MTTETVLAIVAIGVSTFSAIIAVWQSTSARTQAKAARTQAAEAVRQANAAESSLAVAQRQLEMLKFQQDQSSERFEESQIIEEMLALKPWTDTIREWLWRMHAFTSENAIQDLLEADQSFAYLVETLDERLSDQQVTLRARTKRPEIIRAMTAVESLQSEATREIYPHVRNHLDVCNREGRAEYRSPSSIPDYVRLEVHEVDQMTLPPRDLLLSWMQNDSDWHQYWNPRDSTEHGQVEP